MIRVLVPFAPLFSERVFEHGRVLMAGAILTPGRRTVSSALRAMGLDQSKTFHRYHRGLSRAKWSGLEASRVLLDSLVEARSREALLEAIGAALSVITDRDARGFFEHCGYRTMVQLF